VLGTDGILSATWIGKGGTTTALVLEVLLAPSSHKQGVVDASTASPSCRIGFRRIRQNVVPSAQSVRLDGRHRSPPWTTCCTWSSVIRWHRI